MFAVTCLLLALGVACEELRCACDSANRRAICNQPVDVSQTGCPNANVVIFQRSSPSNDSAVLVIPAVRRLPGPTMFSIAFTIIIDILSIVIIIFFALAVLILAAVLVLAGVRQQEQSNKKHGCAQCFRRFSSKHQLTLHLNIWHSAKPTCARCMQAFWTMTELQDHVQSHLPH